MTAEEVYDWLISERIREPVVLVLGTRHVVGRWETISQVEAGDYVCRAGRLAIVVLGEGDDWPTAHANARARLERT